jgi:hypothetical protein
MADAPKNWKQVVQNLKARANVLKAKTNSHKIKTGTIVEMSPSKTRRGGGRGKRRPAKRVPVQFGPKTFENTVRNTFANMSKAVNEARTWGDFQIEEDAKKKEKKKGGRRTRKNKKCW